MSHFYGFFSNYTLSELFECIGQYLTVDKQLLQLVMKNTLMTQKDT